MLNSTASSRILFYGRRPADASSDVYEEKGDLFFKDLSDQVIHDDVFARLFTFPNVLITGHQAYFTAEALTAIAETTVENLSSFEATGQPSYEISIEKLA